MFLLLVVWPKQPQQNKCALVRGRGYLRQLSLSLHPPKKVSQSHFILNICYGGGKRMVQGKTAPPKPSVPHCSMAQMLPPFSTFAQHLPQFGSCPFFSSWSTSFQPEPRAATSNQPGINKVLEGTFGKALPGEVDGAKDLRSLKTLSRTKASGARRHHRHKDQLTLGWV